MSLNNIILKNSINEYDVEHWMSGECIPFAVALNNLFPKYKIAVLLDIIDDEIENGFNFVHAFCYNPNNHKIIIDALGIRPLKDIYDYFHDINPEIDWDIPNSKYLIDNFAGKEFYSEESYEYDIREYNDALEWIKNHKHLYNFQ